jgi:hypothetical protein
MICPLGVRSNSSDQKVVQDTNLDIGQQKTLYQLECTYRVSAQSLFPFFATKRRKPFDIIRGDVTRVLFRLPLSLTPLCITSFTAGNCSVEENEIISGKRVLTSFTHFCFRSVSKKDDTLLQCSSRYPLASSKHLTCSQHKGDP